MWFWQIYTAEVQVTRIRSNSSSDKGPCFCVKRYWLTDRANMSVAFVPKRHRGKAKIDQETIQRLLDENDQLIRCIAEYMQKGRAMDCVQYQQILHRNIVYLGTIADACPNLDSSRNSTKDAPVSAASNGYHGT